VDLLASIRKISTNNAKDFVRRYGTVKGVVTCRNYEEFKEFHGVSKVKIDSLISAFKGRFVLK
jgi:ERCC4-type nuclease